MTNLECRVCGKQVVFVAADQARGFLPTTQKPKKRFLALHADEVGERPTTTTSKWTMLQLRAKMEDSCRGRLERAS